MSFKYPDQITEQNAQEIATELRNDFNALYGDHAFENIYFGDLDKKDGLSQQDALAGTFNLTAHPPLMIHFLSRALKISGNYSSESWKLFKQFATNPYEESGEPLTPDFDAIQAAVTQRLRQENFEERPSLAAE